MLEACLPMLGIYPGSFYHSKLGLAYLLPLPGLGHQLSV